MKFTTAVVTAILSFTSTVVAAPTDYTPKGGWESVTYPKGTGENLEHYPPPPGGWGSVDYSGGAACQSNGFKFTSSYHVVAKGNQVVNGTTPAPGPVDAVGYFDLFINGPADTICYNITLLNVAGTYQSPAKTATHLHQAARGASGPPRLAFPNPVGDDKKRVSVGCLTGPFTTGLKGNDGLDTATGFRVSQIEANPAGFFADSHTKLFVPGVVRGQLA